MSRIPLISLLAISIFLTGCEHFFGFVSNPGGNSGLITGAVVAVQLEVFGKGNGSSGTLTAVTFEKAGFMSSMSFCGDQRHLFSFEQVVRVNFQTETYCSTLISVTLQG